MNFPSPLEKLYVSVADNKTITDPRIIEFTEPIVFLSKIDYSDVPAEDLLKFVKSHIFLPRLEDFKFAFTSGKDPKYTVLASTILKYRYFEAEMDNHSKYIITNFPILEGQALKDIKPANAPSWLKAYDGRFGFVLTAHEATNDVIYYNYAASINHRDLHKLDGRSANTIVRL